MPSSSQQLQRCNSRRPEVLFTSQILQDLNRKTLKDKRVVNESCDEIIWREKLTDFAFFGRTTKTKRRNSRRKRIMTMAMSNSVWALLCLLTAVSAFHPHKIHSEGRPTGNPTIARYRRGRVFHLELPTPINGETDTRLDTKMKDGSNQYKDLLGSFSADLDRLSELRPPIAAADISAEKTIISAGSSYTRLWTHSSWRRHAT
jgi:hypothetical protein